MSMTQLVSDMSSFLFVMTIFVTAFAVGLWIIYHPYSGYQRNINGNTIVQTYAFDYLGASFGTLFWGLLGNTNPPNANIVLPEIKVCIV